MNRTKKHDLGIRTLINGLSAILIGCLIFFAHYQALSWIFVAAVAAISATAIWEYDQFVKKKGLAPAITLSMLASIAYIFSVFMQAQAIHFNLSSFLVHTPEIILVLTFLGCFVHFSVMGLPPITHIATTFFGIVYIAIPLGLLVRMMYFFTNDSPFEGSWWIIYLIAVTKSADIGGYFIGSFFGKRKLALKLSPKKTLEGALGGLVISILVSLWICFLGKQQGEVFEKFSYIQAIWIGLLIGALGQIGDLAESFLKRDAGVKDSNSLPGVGGVLDMIDSLLFTTPVVYIFLRITYT